MKTLTSVDEIVNIFRGVRAGVHAATVRDETGYSHGATDELRKGLELCGICDEDLIGADLVITGGGNLGFTMVRRSDNYRFA